MRRFRLTGPEILIGGTSFQRLSQTILVTQDKVAVLEDDDPRVSSIARNTFYFQEVDEEGNDIESPELIEPPEKIDKIDTTVFDGIVVGENDEGQPVDQYGNVQPTPEASTTDLPDPKTTKSRGVRKQPTESGGV